jgi:hypothetical protein
MNGKRCGLAMGLTLVALITWMTWSGASARREAGSAPAYTSYASGEFFFPPYPSNSDRMGVGGSIGMYNPALQAGWYTDWRANSNPPHPSGMEYARTVYFNIHDTGTICGSRSAPAWQRSQVIETITGTALMDNLRANPGALWLIGNEPDSIYNGSPIMPELYAELYHEFYTFIKAHDPSARVAIGAIVQPSPLRLEYLDKVLNRYQVLYGEKLPTALWNIHLYAFREVACDYGAGTPPGASGNGWPYEWWQWSDADLAAQHLRDMRQWMTGRGERDKPLIVTEFGQLMPDDGSWCYSGGCITQETSRTTLQNDFSYFLTLTDTQTGYPDDGNRLIQLWAWYSLYDSYYGGDLVYSNPPTLTLSPAGQAFAQIASQHHVPYVDLYPVPLITLSIPAGSSGPISVSLVVQLDNRGNQAVQSVPVRFAQYDYASGQLLAGDLITVGQVFTRYGGVQPQVNHEWLLAPGTLYTLTFEIDPAQTINQARRSEQSLTYLRWQPNLVMTAIKSDYPAVFYWERPVTTTITTSIHNLGYVTSTATSLQLSVAVPGGETYPGETLVVPPLPPDASVDITGSQVMPSLGEHTITATLQLVRPDGGVYSSSTVLNLLATAPDLTITSLTSDDRVVYYQGDPITTQTITATIRNSGIVASFPGKVEFSESILSGGTVYIGQVEIVPSLAPGTSVPVTATLMISSPGFHVVTATVQYDHLELDSQNNTATLNILAAAHRLYLPLILRTSPSQANH